jgi:hypothetical protein
MPEPHLGKRLGWFVALWAAGVAVVGTVGLILRAWLMGSPS